MITITIMTIIIITIITIITTIITIIITFRVIAKFEVGRAEASISQGTEAGGQPERKRLC